MPTIIITGLPGTGKTTLAAALAASYLKSGKTAMVCHTDILKVTLRAFYPKQLKGPGYSGDIRAKVECMRPYLKVQAEKADKEQYLLIIEGTLALGFYPPNSRSIMLELPEQARRARIMQKHSSACKSLSSISVESYSQLLIESLHPETIRLSADKPAAELVLQIRELVD